MLPDLQVTVTYNGQDVSNFVQPNLISIRYLDACAFKSDCVEIDVADPQHQILLFYQFQIGQTFSISLTSNGTTASVGTLYLSAMDVDGPPSIVKLKLSTVKPFNPIKHHKRNKGVENTSLQALASQIAARNGYSLNYQATQNVTYSRTDQTDQSDLTYLAQRCEEAGMALKINNGQVIIFSEDDYENRPIIATFSLNPKTNIQLTKWRLSTKSTDVYGSSTVSYTNPKTGLVTQATVTDPDGSFQGQPGPELIDHTRPSYDQADESIGDEGYN